jgi:methylenetetrahydrofolate dehydrogenase (NADP+)/methenyltetrahydrofolate cyclohydrolase
VKPGACVIDVGTTPVDGAVRGDVDRASVEPVAGWLSPVPGGVGPMTIAMLLHNVLSLAAARRRQHHAAV